MLTKLWDGHELELSGIKWPIATHLAHLAVKRALLHLDSKDAVVFQVFGVRVENLGNQGLMTLCFYHVLAGDSVSKAERTIQESVRVCGQACLGDGPSKSG